MDVHNELGKGFAEGVYSDALEFELKSHGVPCKREISFKINYKGKLLAHQYVADFVVEEKIILELKAIERLANTNVKQVLNYLAASRLELGLLVNFEEDSLQHKRIVL